MDVKIVDILVKYGLAKSKGEAKRLIEQGAVRVWKLPENMDLKKCRREGLSLICSN